MNLKALILDSLCHFDKGDIYLHNRFFTSFKTTN
ncbi:hypothetical protein SAMN05421841_3758 [Chryseobacterium wanjuense]|uniref:Uncharacterized protein n=1 Tax=Chryseobacterium wanjuense TaxID=356305 RepID=A0A1I0S1K8_9FLAO|nr:hypothetical protein SAMN05421841_3758 [Chryseobacterium wanjuense]